MTLFPTYQTETMDAEDYSFFLAYGMTHKDEELDSLLNVEMYNTLEDGTELSSETSHGTILS